MRPPASAAVTVIAVGNDGRGDDAVGHVLARRLKAAPPPNAHVLEASSAGTALLDTWRGARAVILLDAVCSGSPPGTIHRLDARTQTIPSRFLHCSTHDLGAAEAIELARALGALPPRLIVWGIEGNNFASGVSLSPAVENVLAEAERLVRQEIEALAKV